MIEVPGLMDGGKEIARRMPPSTAKVAPAALLDSWAQHRLSELVEIFPEPVLGVSEILEDSGADIWER